MNYLRQSTAVTEKFGPFVDATTGVDPEVALTIQKANVRVSKNGGNMAAASADQGVADAGAPHDELGVYDGSLDATDTGTLGRLRVDIQMAGAAPWWDEWEVVPAVVYDAMVAGSDYLQTDVTQWKGATAPAMTGDAYARIGEAGANLTALGDTRLANLNATVGSREASGAAATAVATLNNLSAQNVADALKLAPTAGDPAAGSVNKHLDDIITYLATTGVLLSSDALEDIWTYDTRTLTMTLYAIAQASASDVSMRSIRELAEIADKAFPSKTGTPNLVALEYFIEEAYTELVARVGGLYRETAEITITPGTRYYALPSRYRELTHDGVVAYYTARTISNVARVSNVVTVTTTAAHGLAVGAVVDIDDVTAVGSTTFDEEGVTVLAVPSTTSFTFAQTDDDDTGTGGTVECSESSLILEFAHLEDLTLQPEGEAAQAQITTYFFSDAYQIGFDSLPDGTYPCVYFSYDAQVPALTSSEDLRGPQWMEKGLIAYAAAKVGSLAMDQGMAIYEATVRQWAAERSRREVRNRG